MFPASTYCIRLARADEWDVIALRWLAERDSARVLTGRVLVAEKDGAMVAALSIDEGRTIADPFHPSEMPLALLRMRAGALVGFEREPSLPARILAATRVRGAFVTPRPARP